MSRRYRSPTSALPLTVALGLLLITGCGRRESAELPLPPGRDIAPLADCLQARLPALAESAPDLWPPHAVERSADGRALAWRPLVPRGEIGYALAVAIDDDRITLDVEAMGPYGTDLDDTPAQLDAARRITQACIDVPSPSTDPSPP